MLCGVRNIEITKEINKAAGYQKVILDEEDRTKANKEKAHRLEGVKMELRHSDEHSHSRVRFPLLLCLKRGKRAIARQLVKWTTAYIYIYIYIWL